VHQQFKTLTHYQWSIIAIPFVVYAVIDVKYARKLRPRTREWKTCHWVYRVLDLSFRSCVSEHEGILTSVSISLRSLQQASRAHRHEWDLVASQAHLNTRHMNEIVLTHTHTHTHTYTARASPVVPVSRPIQCRSHSEREIVVNRFGLVWFGFVWFE